MLNVEPIENEGEWVSPCLSLIVFISLWRYFKNIFLRFQFLKI